MVVSSDYAFKFTSTGIELNGNNNMPSPGSPIYDVYKIGGLDLAPIGASNKDYDGVDGGAVEARFMGVRTITIDMTVVAYPSDSLETYLDALKKNYAPSAVEQNLYLKAPGAVERRIGCKCIAFRYDWDTSRRFNSAVVQIVLQAQDPYMYGSVHNNPANVAVNTNLIANNVGNANVKPYMVSVGSCTSPWFNNVTTGHILKFDGLVIASGHQLIVDFHDHTAYDQVIATGVNVNVRSKVTLEDWWDMVPGNNTVKLQVAAGTPTFNYQWDDGWY